MRSGVTASSRSDRSLRNTVFVMIGISFWESVPLFSIVPRIPPAVKTVKGVLTKP